MGKTVRVPLSTTLATKSGKVAASGFSGNPKKITVDFTDEGLSDFPDANYSVTAIGDQAVRTWTYESLTASSFVINSNTNSPPTGDLSWTATAHGES